MRSTRTVTVGSDLAQSEEIMIRSCAIAGPIDPIVTRKAFKSSLNIRQQLPLSWACSGEAGLGAFGALNQRARFSKISFATGMAENTLGQPT
jgi:hypothetical protein